MNLHRRSVYNFFDFLGDIGGVSSVFIYVMSKFVNPITKMAAYLKLIKHLFLARSHDKKLFIESKGKK